MSENMDEKLRDLLADRALFGLSEEEAKQLEELSDGADMDAQSYEAAAAAFALAETQTEPMPDHLEAKLLRAANVHFASAKEEIQESIHDQPTQSFKWTEPKASRSFFDWFGWAAAAAASIVLMVTFIYYQDRLGKLETELARARTTPTPAPSLAEQRDRLMAEATDLTRAEWKGGPYKPTEGVTGEVVWSDSKQQGYMTLRGLPVNDANVEAYQLWMFEDAALEEFPKDGGVFNVTANGEVIIPIDAKLRTIDPKAFAITIEKPGGVVRSERGKLAALAPVKPSST
jgi:anti-sigma-K factor RskA